jgi:hypothetical protein
VLFYSNIVRLEIDRTQVSEQLLLSALPAELGEFKIEGEGRDLFSFLAELHADCVT